MVSGSKVIIINYKLAINFALEMVAFRCLERVWSVSVFGLASSMGAYALRHVLCVSGINWRSQIHLLAICQRNRHRIYYKLQATG